MARLRAMKRVLVTGSSGFVGRHVLPLLDAQKWDVVAVRRCDGDLRHAAEAEALVSRVMPSHLLHLAWNAVHGEYWTAPDNEQWADATIALARAFAKHGGQRFVAAGTCAEYDWTRLEGPCREDATPAIPQTVYGRAKLRALRGVERVMEDARVAWAWGRLFFLYGPGEDQQRLIPSVLRALKSGERASVTEGSQVRDFLHVDDAARAFVALLESDIGGPVNIGSGVGRSVREVVEEIVRLTQRPDAVDFGVVSMPAGEPAWLVADISRLRATGWNPAIPLTAGLSAYC